MNHIQQLNLRQKIGYELIIYMLAQRHWEELEQLYPKDLNGQHHPQKGLTESLDEEAHRYMAVQHLSPYFELHSEDYEFHSLNQGTLVLKQKIILDLLNDSLSLDTIKHKLKERLCTIIRNANNQGIMSDGTGLMVRFMKQPERLSIMSILLKVKRTME